MMVDPINPIGILIRLLFFLLMFLGVSRTVTQPTPPSSPNGGTSRSYTLIDSVETQVMESYPYQVRLVVSGQQPDGCDFPVMVEQWRDGDTFYVEIYRNIPVGVMCPMVLLPYSAQIPLMETLKSGQYTININGTIVELDL
ncbi:MAG: hypothetical protein H6672_03040 [Anaerolineaceae bacterium]|nr:hypothetical protein [Anaerolineaceae bacterium]